MKHIPETVVQQSIYIDFNNKYCLKKHEPRLIIYSVTNGFGINLPKEMPACWAKIVNNEISKINQLHVKLGMLAGVSDLKIEGVFGRVLSVEVKTETGVQSESQIKMEARVKELKGRYIVVRSLLDFNLQITEHIDWLLGKQ